MKVILSPTSRGTRLRLVQIPNPLVKSKLAANPQPVAKPSPAAKPKPTVQSKPAIKSKLAAKSYPAATS